MKISKCLKTTLLVTVLILAFFPQTAHAYIDPGTGSYIFQLLMAAVLGGLFALKLSWRKVKLFFGRGKKNG